jgi:tetratricopeptide (TPR) repeat protein
MHRLHLTLVSLVISLLVIAPQTRAQQTRVAERDAEWEQYALPQSTFVRQLDQTTTVLFQVPSDWKRKELTDKLSFSEAHGATLTFFVQKIPDGLPLRDYVAALLEPLRAVPDSADSMVVRRTTMSGLEAREIVFESDANTADLRRSIIWSTVNGPDAISVVLTEPFANASDIEPYFKAIVQSVVLLDKYDYDSFAALRSTAIKDSIPRRVDEVQLLAASFSSLDGATRQASIKKLAGIFAATPDMAIDLLLDRRAMVRAAAVEAVVQSGNSALSDFVMRAVGDRELYVAQQAARSIAGNSNVIDLLRSHSFEWLNIESVARVWPFLARQNQIKILDEIFSQRLLPDATANKASGANLGRPSVTVKATVVSPGAASSVATTPVLAQTSDPSRQLNALTLLRDIPATEFKLPLAAILAAKNDKLTTLALQVGWWREELIPAPELLKLLSSSPSREVRRLAALNLGQSGSESDIKSIQAFMKVPEPAPESAPVAVADPKTPDPGPSLNDNLQLTISRIRFREQLATASGEAREQLIKKGMTDPKLAEWVWYRFVRQDPDKQKPLGNSNAGRPVIQPLGENVFPRDLTYYAAFPEPAVALDKFSAAVDGLQLDSARSQSNLVLILSSLRERLAQQLDSPAAASPLAYSGINVKQPIALASWYAEGAPRGVPSGERRAIILRVTDRARFERLLTLYQRSIGNFEGLTNYSSGIVRFLTVLPAFLPLTAKAILADRTKPSEQTSFLKYSFVGETQWQGHSIKVVEQRKVDAGGHMFSDSAYLTYLGDTAVLAPNIESVRDVLTRAADQRETLATNPGFQQAKENPGEAIYLSNVTQLIATPSENQVSENNGVVTESGALTISNSTWENRYRIQFSERDWAKPFIGFQPGELVSPRELLPRSTVAYYFMNFDTVAGWRDWSKQLFNAEEAKELTSIWAADFEKDVLPELGPECGLAVLGLPDILSAKWDIPWVAFFKLKSDKLAKSFTAGTLLKNATAGNGSMQIKLKSGDWFVAVKGNFLVLSNNRSGFAGLDEPDKLISSRDFSRAAKQVPPGVIAFGGYNLEAAIAAVGNSGVDTIKTQQAAVIASLADAFHSPNFYATATADAIEGRFSLSMDREGRFSVSELASLSKDYRLSYAQLEPHGVPIQNQERLSSLKLRMSATAAGEIDRLKEDVTSAYQTPMKISDKELELNVLARHGAPKTTLTLPIKGAEFASYLQPTMESRSDDAAVIERARSIAGEERNAWQVARKLTDWTYKNITWKRVDSATAQQTLATLEADCLEFSQLYIAMARSLGLPARMVSGMAYSGAAFGGHAWVEVYVGEWIEVDPTWGTDFVDATHIRDSSTGALLTYASLNLVQLEVLEAPRSVADFQKDPRALAEKLGQELPHGEMTALTSSLDLSVLTAETPRLGAWDSLSDAERELMSTGYRRVLLEINGGFSREGNDVQDFRVLQVKTHGDTAEAMLIEPSYKGQSDSLLKLFFVHRNEAWFLTDVLQLDSDYHIIAEMLQPSIKTILERRSNRSARAQRSSDVVRILIAIVRNPTTAVAMADRALKADPGSQRLRHLKALALMRNKMQEEALKIWEELAAEKEPFAPALLNLAEHYSLAEKPEQKEIAIQRYNQYAEIVPEDPRPHNVLAELYQDLKDDAHAAAEYRAAIKSDPLNTTTYTDFATFLAVRKRFTEAVSTLDDAHKSSAAVDLFGDLMMNLYFSDDPTLVDELARTEPQRMARSATASLYLAYALVDHGSNLQAIPLLKKAAAIKSNWADPYVAMSRAYRNMRNWSAALIAADAAIKIDVNDGEAHFQRACALARLGRINEALAGLTKAVELDPELSATLSDEADLKVLAAKPGFKKLLPSPEPKQEEKNN